MAYGTVKVDTIIFDQGGTDQNVTVSGIYRAITSGVTVSGTISGAVLVGTTTVSGATVTGTTANFASGVFTTQVSGLTVTGTQSSFTSGNFVTLSGATATFTSGVIASGTAAAPSLSILGDPNTGIYSPGADTLAFVEGGVEAMRITSAGLVGIGTSSPGKTLDVAGEIRIYPASGDANLRFGSGGVEKGRIAVNSSSNCIIETAGSERLRITSAGIVGIGTSSPGKTLDVTGTARVSSILTMGSYIQGTTQLDLYGDSTSSSGVRLDSSGRLGIGTTSPGAGLHIATVGQTTSALDTSGSLNLLVSDTGASVGNGGSIVFGFNSGSGRFASIKGSVITGGGNSTGHLTFSTRNATSDATLTERLRITNDGLVGIGTTSPATTLDVNGDVTITDKIIHGGDTNTAIRFPAADTVTVETAGSERARIDSSGRLLVGTSTTSGSAAAIQIVQGFAGINNAGCLLLSRTNNTPASDDALGEVVFGDSGHTRAAEIRSVRDGGTWTSGSSQPTRLVFSTTADGAASPTERMRINAAGAFKVSTNGAYLSSSDTTNEVVQSNSSALGLSIYTSSASYASTALGVSCNRNTTNNTYYFIEASVYGVAYRFQVADSGNVTNANNSYGGISDRKFKENIVDAASQWNDIKALQVCKYNFKEETGQPTHTQIGLIAQEVELISPGLVNESPDRDEDGNDLGTVTKSVNYSVLYMKAVKALQEAMERIETLEARLTAAGIE